MHIKKLLFIICFGIVMLNYIGVASAGEITCIFTDENCDNDNVKKYDAETKTITIKNSLLGIDWLSYGKVADITLDTPLNVKVGLGNQTVAEFTINSYENYDNAFKEMEFYDKRDGNKRINRTFFYKYKVIIPYNYSIYSYCDGQDNKSNCKTEFIRNETRYREGWENFNEKSQLPKGNVTIGIFTDVQKGDYVEWIPNYFGVRINEWAVWTENLGVELIAYYSLNESSGNMIDYSFGSQNDATCYNTPNQNINGKIDLGINFTSGSSEECIVLGSPPTNTLISNISLSVWVNVTQNSSAEFMVSRSADGVGRQRYGLRVNNGFFDCTGSQSDDTQVYATSTSFAEVNTWYHIVCNWNGTYLTIWKDGVAEKIGSWDGTHKLPASIYALTFGNRGSPSGDVFYEGVVDEIGVWNRSLTSSEISDLYNGGSGISYVFFAGSVNVTLDVPIDSSDSTVDFSGNVSTSINPISNVSLIINATYNQTNTSGINNTFYNFSTILVAGDFYNWTMEVCDDTNICINATTRDLNISNLIENNFTYNATAVETSNQTYILNVTPPEILEISTAYLDYDGNLTLSTLSQNGSDYIITANRNAPSVATDTNKTFFFIVNFNDSSQENSSTNNQTVLNLGIDNCSTYGEEILNITLNDEEANTQINGSLGSNIEIDLLLTSITNLSLTWAYNNTWINETNVSVCIPSNILNSSEYYIDFDIGLESTDHVWEFFFLDDGVLNETKVFDAQTNYTITLMDLLTADSTSFLFNYFDQDGLPVDDIIIHVFRKYIGEGVFREVERAKADENADTVIHLVEEDVIYYFLITQYGIPIYTSSTYTALCQATPCTIQLEAGGEGADFSTDWDLISGGGYDISSNANTRIVTLNYSLNASSTMNVTLYKYDNDGNVSVITSNQSTDTDDVLTLNVPQSAGNVSFFASLYQDGDFINSEWVDFESKPQDRFGIVLSLFLGALIILTLGLLAISEGVGTLVMVILGVLISGALGLITTTLSSGVNIIVYLTIAGGILLWKLTGGRK